MTTLLPFLAKRAPKLETKVDLPVPPFPLATGYIMGRFFLSWRTLR